MSPTCMRLTKYNMSRRSKARSDFAATLEAFSGPNGIQVVDTKNETNERGRLTVFHNVWFVAYHLILMDWNWKTSQTFIRNKIVWDKFFFQPKNSLNINWMWQNVFKSDSIFRSKKKYQHQKVNLASELNTRSIYIKTIKLFRDIERTTFTPY